MTMPLDTDFHFTFDTPQDPVVPPSGDPNLLPLPLHESNDHASTIVKYRLATVPLDLKRMIMSLLTGKDITSLMQTCSNLLDAGLLELVSRLPRRPINTLDHAISFHKFLHVGGGPSSRGHLVRSLWVAFPRIGGPDVYTPAIITVVQCCSHLRRLRIDDWPLNVKADSINTLLYTISYCSSLEDLTIPPSSYMNSQRLSELMHLLPLRRLAFHPKGLLEKAQTLVIMHYFPRTLVELDHMVLPGYMLITQDAVNVRKLGVCMDRDSLAFVENLTATFPNVTSLRLWASPPDSWNVERSSDNCDCACCSSNTLGEVADDLDEAAILLEMRTHNLEQWRSWSASRWTSLEAIWAAQLDDLYGLGLCVPPDRNVPYLSLPLGIETPPYFAPWLQTVLADLRPTGCLELRVRWFHYNISTSNELTTGSAAALLLSVPHLILHFTSGSEFDYLRDAMIMLIALKQGSETGLLKQKMPLTHLLLRHTKGDPSTEDGDPTFCPAEAGRILEFVAELLLGIAQALPTLQWVGLDIRGLGLRCWEVSRPSMPGSPATLVDMSEQSGWRIIKAKRMDMFASR